MWHEILMERLADSEDVIGYLEVSFEEYLDDGDKAFFLKGIKNVIEAQGGILSVSEHAGIDPGFLSDAVNNGAMPPFHILNSIFTSFGGEPLINKLPPIKILGVKETEIDVLTQSGHPLGWLLRVLQKEHADETEISEALADAVSHLVSVDEDFAPQIAEALRYFVQLIFHRRSLDERDALVDIIRQHIQDSKELETMAQTTAEFLIEQGKAEGKAEGIAEGKQDAVLKLLQLRFQHVPETLSRQISNIHSLTHLDTLLEQAMTAQSLEEIDTHSALKST